MFTDLRILVVDDERLEWFESTFESTSLDALTLVSTPEEGLEEMSLFVYDVLFLDHDLQSSLDGSGVLSEIFWNPWKYFAPRVVWTHSENGEGRKNIVSKCKSAGVPVKNVPFGNFYRFPEVFKQELASYLNLLQVR